MNANEQIDGFYNFLEKNYKEDIVKSAAKEQKRIIIDFFELSKFDPDLADLLLEQPEEIIKAGELALEKFDIKNCKIRFTNLPNDQKILIRNIRSKDIGKFLLIDGVIRQKSDVRPQVTIAKFECPSCGQTINVPQLDSSFKEPSRCSCGRKGKFRLLSKELVDAQGIVLEEDPESLEGGLQPKRMNVFLRDDLVSPLSERKTSPGSKIKVIGLVKEVPIILRSGSKSIRFDLLIEANNVEAIEETFLEVEVSEEDEKRIFEIAKSPNVYKKLIASVSPSIYGYERIKEALLVQMVGGVHKTRIDGTVTRGDIHVLLVGDPGCIAGEELVFMADGTLKRIENFGNEHLENISCKVKVDRYFQYENPCAKAVTFFEYPNQKVKKIITETGKELCCSYNHPLYVKRNRKKEWIKAENLSKGDVVKVMRFVPCFKKSYEKLKRPIIKLGPQAKKVHIPVCNENIGLFYGYLVGDGSVTKSDKKNYNRITLYVNEEEQDIIPLFSRIINEEFKIAPTIEIKKPKSSYMGKRLINRKQKITCIVINSKILGGVFKSAAVKKVPDIILSSKKSVVSRFLSGLFEADGCVFVSKRKNRIDKGKIQLKSTYSRLLLDVQTLLIKFGMQARINKDNLIIARSDDIVIFEKKIGFISSKKKGKLQEVVNVLSKPRRNRKRILYEKIKQIVEEKRQTVYDIEVKKAHRFISNGIISHNSGKSQLLKRVNIISPKARYVSGKGVSAAGLCVAPDSLVLTNPGGMYKIKDIVEEKLKNNQIKYCDGVWQAKDKENKKNILTLNSSLKIEPREIGQFWKLRAPKEMVKIKTRSGKEIYLTKNTKLFSIEDGKPKWEKAILLKEKSFVATVKKENTPDIFWDEITKKEIIKPEYDYVYDLTVEDSHNFIVNGFVVHNTASVVRDEFLRGWSLEAGAMVLASNGLCCIDELDKMSTEDSAAMHEALENQTVSISKANIQATLIARTTVLAAANPKFGRFDPYDILAKQINLPPTLINRFDLIFPIKDLPDVVKDERLASHILNLHQSPEINIQEIETSLLKKYIAYAKQKIRPTLTDSALEEIKKYYIEMRNKDVDEGAARAIPISPRQLEALIRMSEAFARIRLSDKVGKRDARKAIDLLHFCLKEVGLDPETGKIDIDRITTGITASQRSHIVIIKEIIVELENKLGKTIPIEEVMNAAKEKGIDEDKAEEVIEKLKRSGDLYEPRHGLVSRV